MRIFKERRLYFFTCEQCGKVNRHSFKRRKAQGGVCKKCKRQVVDPNQQALFPQPLNQLEIHRQIDKILGKIN
jgi:uncharacterized OB-fold protein